MKLIGHYNGKPLYQASEDVAVLVPDWRGRMFLWHRTNRGSLVIEAFRPDDLRYSYEALDGQTLPHNSGPEMVQSKSDTQVSTVNQGFKRT